MKSLITAFLLLVGAQVHASETCTLMLGANVVFSFESAKLYEVSCTGSEPMGITQDQPVPGSSLSQAMTNVIQQMDTQGFQLVTLSSAWPIHYYVLVFQKASAPTQN